MSEIDETDGLAEAQENKGNSSSKAIDAASSEENRENELPVGEQVPRGTTPSLDDSNENAEDLLGDEASSFPNNSHNVNTANIYDSQENTDEEEEEEEGEPPLIPEPLSDSNDLILKSIQQMLHYESEKTRKLMEPYYEGTKSSLSENIKHLSEHLTKSHQESNEFFKSLDTQDTVLKFLTTQVQPQFTLLTDKIEALDTKLDNLSKSFKDERNKYHQRLQKVTIHHDKILEIYEGLKGYIALKEGEIEKNDKARPLLNAFSEMIRDIGNGIIASSGAESSSKNAQVIGLIEGVTRSVALQKSTTASDEVPKKKTQRCFICSSSDHGRHCTTYPTATERFNFFVSENRCVKCGQAKGTAEHRCGSQYHDCRHKKCIEANSSNPQGFSLSHHALLCPSLIDNSDKKPKKAKAKNNATEVPESSEQATPPVSSSEPKVKPIVEGESAPPVAPKLSRREKRALQQAKAATEVEPSAKKQKKQKKTTVAKSAEQPVTISTQTLN